MNENDKDCVDPFTESDLEDSSQEWSTAVVDAWTESTVPPLKLSVISPLPELALDGSNASATQAVEKLKALLSKAITADSSQPQEKSTLLFHTVKSQEQVSPLVSGLERAVDKLRSVESLQSGDTAVRMPSPGRLDSQLAAVDLDQTEQERFLQLLTTPLHPLDRAQLNGLFLGLRSNNPTTWTNALRALWRMGPSLVPELQVRLRQDDSPEVTQRFQFLFTEIVAKREQSITRRLSDISASIESTGLHEQQRAEVERLIQTADHLRQNPLEVQSRRALLLMLSGFGSLMERPGYENDSTQNEALAELDGVKSIPIRARLAAVSVFIAANDEFRAHRLLLECMKMDSSVTTNPDFLQAFVRARGMQNTTLAAEFAKTGGDNKILARIAANLIVEPRTTSDLLAGLDPVGTQSQQTREERLAEYAGANNKRQIALMIDHYLSAGTDDAARQLALQELRRLADNRDVHASTAQNALGQIHLRAEYRRADIDLNTWSRGQSENDGELAALRAISPNNREGRNHRAIEIIVARYRNAIDQPARHAARELLISEVQDGNISALTALKAISTMDAILRLADATRRLQSNADGRARADQERALLDLAMMAAARQREGISGSGAGSVLDYLRQRPCMGVTAADVQRAQSAATIEHQQLQQAATREYQLVLCGGGEVTQSTAIQSFRALSRAQISRETSTALHLLQGPLAFTATFNNVRQSTDNLPAMADLLLELVSRRNALTVKPMLERLGSSEQGTQLKAALESGKRERILRILEQPGSLQVLALAMNPLAHQQEMLASLPAVDLIDAAGGNANLETLYRDSQRRLQHVYNDTDRLVGDYLYRDHSHPQMRNTIVELLSTASNGLRLEELGPEFKISLRDSLKLRQFSPAATQLLSKLVEAGTLSATDVNSLALILQRDVRTQLVNFIRTRTNLSLTDLDVEFGNSLWQMIKNDRFDETTSKILRGMFTGSTLTRTSVETLIGNLTQQGVRGSTALNELNQLSRDTIHLTDGVSEGPLKDLESLGNARDIQAALTASLSELHSGSTETISRSLDTLIQQLERLQTYASDGRHHRLSLRLAQELTRGSGSTLSGLLVSLRELRPGTAVEAIAHLLNSLTQVPDGETIANEFRALRIVRSVRPGATEEQLRLTRNLLDQEIEASRLEGNLNRSAVDWRAWTIASETVIRISACAPTETIETLRASIHTLGTESRNGNVYAREALAAILAIHTNVPDTMAYWLRTHGERNGKQLYVPNLAGLSESMRNELAEIAVDEIAQLAEQGQLTAELASSVAIAYASRSERGEAFDCTLYTILQDGMRHPATRQFTLTGIMEAIRSRAPHTEALAHLYINRQRPDQFSVSFENGGLLLPSLANHLPDLEAAARRGDGASLTILAAITAGVADTNLNVNPYRRHTNGTAIPPHVRSTTLQDGGTVVEQNPISRQARCILEAAASQHRASATAAMMNFHGMCDWRFDNREFMGTLGRIASTMPPGEFSEDIRLALRSAFRYITNSDDNWRDSDEHRYRCAYHSAFEGFLAASRHWTVSDAQAITPGAITPELLEHLRQFGDQIPRPAARAVLDMLELQLRAEPERLLEHRMNALRCMAALAPHMSEHHVRVVANYGTDATYDGAQLGLTNRVRGNLLLNGLGLQGQNRNIFQAECAAVLLQVLARSQNSPTEGMDGPRELAFTAFTGMPWHIYQNGSSGAIVNSVNSGPLREALVAYFQESEFRPDLAAEINLIVDGANLPRPTAALLLEHGIARGAVGSNRPVDRPANVFEIARQINLNYSTNGRNGERIVREVLGNIEVLNTLPPHLRAQLMGWNELSATQKAALGWRETPFDFDWNIARYVRSLSQWNRMSEAQRNEFRWLEAQHLNPQLIIGQMFNNCLQRSPFRDLLADIPARLNAQTLAARQQLQSLQQQIQSLEAQRTGNLEQLITMTGNGLPLRNRLARNGVEYVHNYIGGTLRLSSLGNVNLHNLDDHFSQLANNADGGFSRRQGTLAGSFDGLRAEMARLQAPLQASHLRLAQLEAIARIGEYIQFRNNGQLSEARRLAVGLLQEHGINLSQICPRIWQDLVESRDSSITGSSILRQLKLRNAAHWDTLPIYSTGNGTESGNTVLRRVLGLTNSLNANERQGLLQLRGNPSLLDLTALRGYMFQSLHSDSVLSDFSRTASEIQQQMQEFSGFAEAAQRGHLYEGGLNTLRTHANFLQEAFNRITPNQLAQLRDRITVLDAALREAASNSQIDAATRRQLTETVQTYKRMHDMFNGPGNAPYYFTDGRQNYIHLRDLISNVREGRITATTLANWFRENGPLIVASVAAMALTAAACASCGITSPLAVGAWCAVTGLITREVVNEAFYRSNANGHTGWGPTQNNGARISDFYRRRVEGLDRGEVENQLRDLMLHASKNNERYAIESSLLVDALGTVAIPYVQEVARDWVAFIATASITHHLLAARGNQSIITSFRQTMRPESPALQQLALQGERLALIANGSSPSAAFARQFFRLSMREFLLNSGITASQMSVEAGMQIGFESITRNNLTPERLQQMGETGQFLFSFATSTALALGHGVIVGRQSSNAQNRILEHAQIREGNVLEFRLAHGANQNTFLEHLHLHGYDVRAVPGRNGEWSIRPVGASPSLRPMTIRDMANQVGQGSWLRDLLRPVPVVPEINASSNAATPGDRPARLPALIRLVEMPQLGRELVVKIDGIRLKLSSVDGTTFTGEHGGTCVRYSLLTDNGNCYLVRPASAGSGQPRALDLRRHFASGDGTVNVLDSRLPEIAARRAIAEASLTEPLRASLDRLVDCGPRGIDVVQRILQLQNPEQRKAILTALAAEHPNRRLETAHRLLAEARFADAHLALILQNGDEQTLNHNLNLLDLDSQERTALAQGFGDGSVRFVVLTRDFLRTHDFFTRDNIRPQTQAQLRSAGSYNPLRADQGIFVVRVGDQYHVINGNNRIHLFGCNHSNPHNLGIPVFLFDSPESFQRNIGGECRDQLRRARPFKFD